VNRVIFVLVIALVLAAGSVFAQTPDGEAARAEENRTKAGDFGGAGFFPGEWEAAEGQMAVADYGAASDSFAAIFDLCLPLYAQQREEQIMEMRDAIVDAGARAIFPRLVAPADEAALLAWDKFQSGDYYQARDEADRAQEMFGVLDVALEAWQTKQKAAFTGITGQDAAFLEAESVLEAAMNDYLEGNFPPALEQAGRARDLYAQLLSSGISSSLQEKRALASGERTAAVEARADIAARDIFNRADSIYTDAAVAEQNESYSEAERLLTEAAALFKRAGTLALERRRIATQAIGEAKARIEELLRVSPQAVPDAN
jgi:hypothetical protein